MMQIITANLVSLCLILFSAYSNSLPRAAAEAPAPVLDVKGDELQVGVQYKIRSLVGGAGLALAITRTQLPYCPLGVAQLRGSGPGLPLTFHPANSSESVVRVSTNLNIKFEASSPCPESTVWQVHGYDESSEQYFITTGGKIGNLGCGTIRNWFQIRRVLPRVYKLVSAPKICDIHGKAQDVTIVTQNRVRRLYLNLDNNANARPFYFVFTEATPDLEATKASPLEVQ